MDPNFKWQPKYHDHIIRDRQSFDRISEYIRNNPENGQRIKIIMIDYSAKDHQYQLYLQALRPQSHPFRLQNL